MPYKSSVGKISVRDLLAISLNKISIRGLLARSLYKLPRRGLLARCLCKVSRFVRACAVELHRQMSQEPFYTEIYRKDAASQGRRHRFVRACAVDMHMDILVRKFTGERPDAPTGDIGLCEPAQSKCIWAFHKSHFMRKFTGNCPDTDDTASAEHRALTLTVRTPQCGHTVWGKNKQRKTRRKRMVQDGDGSNCSPGSSCVTVRSG